MLRPRHLLWWLQPLSILVQPWQRLSMLARPLQAGPDSASRLAYALRSRHAPCSTLPFLACCASPAVIRLPRRSTLAAAARRSPRDTRHSTLAARRSPLAVLLLPPCSLVCRAACHVPLCAWGSIRLLQVAPCPCFACPPDLHKLRFLSLLCALWCVDGSGTLWRLRQREWPRGEGRAGLGDMLGVAWQS